MTERFPLLLGDSHGFYMARSFGEYACTWESKVDKPLPVVRDGQVVAEFILLNTQSEFFVYRVEGDRLDVSIQSRFIDLLQSGVQRWSKCYLQFDGNIHNERFMMAGEHPFDFLDPLFADQFVANRPIIPRQTIVDFFNRYESLITYKIKLVQNILKGLTVIFVAPPPPISSVEHILRNPEVFKFDKDSVNDALVRMKVYRVYLDLLTRCCEACGCTIVGPPAVCVDSMGFLLPAYWQGCTHAAPDYYREVTQNTA